MFQKTGRQGSRDKQHIDTLLGTKIHDVVEVSNVEGNKSGVGVSIVEGCFSSVVPVMFTRTVGKVGSPAEGVPGGAVRGLRSDEVVFQFFDQSIYGGKFKAVEADAGMNVAVHIKAVTDGVPTFTRHTFKVFVEGEIAIGQDKIAKAGHGVVVQQIVVVTVGLSHLCQVESCVGLGSEDVGINAVESVAAAENQGADLGAVTLHPLVFVT